MLFRHEGTAALTAVAAVCFVLTAVPAAAGDAARAVDVTFGAATTGAAPSFPPCIDVRFNADVGGLPPFTYSWETDTGEQLSGNPVDLDTTGYATGAHEITLTVSNAAGQAQSVTPFEIEPLVAGTPTAAVNPAPGLTATVEAAGLGYNEWRFVWGDGQATAWDDGCIAPSSHTYGSAGMYLVRLEVRNCAAGPVASLPLPVFVGGTDLFVTEFQAEGCHVGGCAFTAGQPVTFLQDFTQPPALLLYDWDGDGTPDEVSALPVTVHTYPTPGFYRPSVTAEWGTESDERDHPSSVRISSSPEPYVFYDGFETGGAECWSAAPGAPPGSPGPGCFGVE